MSPGVLTLLCWAEQTDPAEVGHAVAFILIVSIPSLLCIGFGIWLAVTQFRHRADPPEPGEEPPPRPIFQPISRPPPPGPPPSADG